MDTLLKLRGQKGFCLFSIFYEKTGIFVKKEKRVDGNDEEYRKNISPIFSGMKKSGFHGCLRKGEHSHKVVTGRLVSEIKAFSLKSQ